MQIGIEATTQKNSVVIDYYNKITHKKVYIEVNDLVAKFIKASNQKIRRNTNKYYYYNESLESNIENYGDLLLIDENSDAAILLENVEEEINRVNTNFKRLIFMRKVLFTLKPEQKMILKMYFFENKTYREIGDTLSITRQSVYDRLRCIKNKIKKYVLKFLK